MRHEPIHSQIAILRLLELDVKLLGVCRPLLYGDLSFVPISIKRSDRQGTDNCTIEGQPYTGTVELKSSLEISLILHCMPEVLRLWRK
ncbi:hypothetical protein Plhal304r1_c062g0149941 [Plasmopara halstedii]